MDLLINSCILISLHFGASLWSVWARSVIKTATTKMEGPAQIMMIDPKNCENVWLSRIIKIAESSKEWKRIQANIEPILQHWGRCGCWSVRCSWLLCLPIQERRCHQGDSSSMIQGRRLDSSSTFRTSNLQVQNGVIWITKWRKGASLTLPLPGGGGGGRADHLEVFLR